VQLPEQQFAFAAQRSPSGLQPASGWHRSTLSVDIRHTPEQQCMSSGQTSPTTEQPPIFWQIDVPDGCAMQEPSQQSEARSQVSPSTRQPERLAQSIGFIPDIWFWQSPEQQSLLVPQDSPAG
jgi:hypothetical protein